MANLTTAKAITFLDIETTHLDPKRSAVLEISIVTDWEGGNTDVWTTKIKPKGNRTRVCLKRGTGDLWIQ